MKWNKTSYTFILFLITTLFSLPLFASLPFFPIEFPRDEAAHHADVPYQFKNLTEWWYFNGKLVTADPIQREFAYFIAVFHILPPGKAAPETVLMMQLTNLNNKKVYGFVKIFNEKDVYFSTKKLDIKLGDSFKLMRGKSSYYLTMQNIEVPGLQHKLSLILSMTPLKEPLLINKTGLMYMYDNTNSYYYSNTRMHTSGLIDIGNNLYNVTADESTSWMDHQWGDFILTPRKRWIWTCAQLDNGMDFSAFELIDNDTKKVTGRLANIIMPDNSRVYTHDIKINTADEDPVSHYPSHYEVVIDPLKLKVSLNSLAPKQNSNGFWEGAHTVAGSYNENSVNGFSYVENTVKYQKRK